MCLGNGLQGECVFVSPLGGTWEVRVLVVCLRQGTARGMPRPAAAAPDADPEDEQDLKIEDVQEEESQPEVR